MTDWNGILTADSPAASVFEFFINEMVHRTVKSKAPNASKWILGEGCTMLMPFTLLALRHTGHLVRLIRKQPDGWFTRPWNEELGDALKTAILILKKKYGNESKNWAWGQIRSLTLKHPVGEQAPMDRIFNLGPIPCGGDADTIPQASVNPNDPTDNPLFIACLRMVLDVGNWDECRFALPGGQAGNPLSPHYGDQLPLWQNGEGVSIAWSSEKIKDRIASSLHLTPDK